MPGVEPVQPAGGDALTGIRGGKSMRSNSPAFRARTLALSAALAALAACAPLPGRMSVGLVYVDQAPPPRRVEVVPVRPGPEFVWIDGYWGWSGPACAWVPGRWERPPRLR